MMKNYNARNGYTLLLTVLVVGTMASTTSIALILLGMSVERNSYSMQLSSQAFYGAWSCVENAIASLQADLEYEGNERREYTYAYDDNGTVKYGITECTIYPIGGTENEDRTICTEATFGNFTIRRLEVHLDRIIPGAVVNSWEEVADIESCDPFTGPPPAGCGNGTVAEGEECDDANTANNDGCSSACMDEFCGDGIQQAGEQCDDDNANSGDGCSATCQIEICNEPGLIGYWRFDETSGLVAADSSGRGNDGTIFGATLGQTGEIGNSFGFSGSAENKVSAISNDWAFTNENFSISAWVNLDDISRSSTLIEFKEGNEWQLLYFDDKTGWTFDVSSGSPNTIVQECISDDYCTGTVAGQWHFVTLVRKGDVWKIYVNGVEIKSKTDTRSIDATQNLSIGYGDTYDLEGEYFNGKIDDVSIWNKDLTLSEIQSLYGGAGKYICGVGTYCGNGTTDVGEQCDDPNSSLCNADCTFVSVTTPSPTDYIGHWELDETNLTDPVVDNSSNSANGDPENGAGINLSDKAPLSFSNTASRDFDGDDDHIYFDGNSSHLFPEQMTVSFWVKSDVPTGYRDGIVCKTNSTNWTEGWGFYFISNSAVGFFIQGLGNHHYAQSTPINPLVWNHIVGIYDKNGGANNIRIYVNGIEGTPGSYSGNIDASKKLTIGGCGDHGNHNIVGAEELNINGKIDDVRIYDYILTADQINALKSGN